MGWCSSLLQVQQCICAVQLCQQGLLAGGTAGTKQQNTAHMSDVYVTAHKK